MVLRDILPGVLCPRVVTIRPLSSGSGHFGQGAIVHPLDITSRGWIVEETLRRRGVSYKGRIVQEQTFGENIGGVEQYHGLLQSVWNVTYSYWCIQILGVSAVLKRFSAPLGVSFLRGWTWDWEVEGQLGFRIHQILSSIQTVLFNWKITTILWWFRKRRKKINHSLRWTTKKYTDGAISKDDLYCWSSFLYILQFPSQPSWSNSYTNTTPCTGHGV